MDLAKIFLEDDYDPNHRVVKAYHHMLLPEELNCVRLYNHDTINESNLKTLGYTLLRLPYTLHYIILHDETVNRTGKVYLYTSDDHAKHLIGKQGASIIKLKNRIGAHIVSGNTYDKLTTPPTKEMMVLTEDVRLGIDKTLINVLPVDVLCDVDLLLYVIYTCLEREQPDSIIYKLANNIISAHNKYGSVSGTKAALHLAIILDKHDCKYCDINGIEKEIGYVNTMFVNHWERISTQPYPIDINRI